MALLRVALKLPSMRPWNPPLKLKMAKSGAPGALFSMQESREAQVRTTNANPNQLSKRQIEGDGD